MRGVVCDERHGPNSRSGRRRGARSFLLRRRRSHSPAPAASSLRKITTVTSYRSAGDTESRSAKRAVQCRVCLQYVKALESYGERKRAKLLPRGERLEKLLLLCGVRVPADAHPCTDRIGSNRATRSVASLPLHERRVRGRTAVPLPLRLDSHRMTGSQYSELLTDMITPCDAQPRLISSIPIAYLHRAANRRCTDQRHELHALD